MKKQNILILPDLFPRFEGDIHGIFILDYLKCVRDKYNILVYYNRLFGTSKGCKTDEIDGIKIIRNTIFKRRIHKVLRPLLYLLWYYKGFSNGISFKDINLIHAHGIILNGTLAYLISRKLKIPFIITIHQGPFSVISENPLFRLWAKIILGKADMVLAVSNHLKNEILNSKINPRNIEVTFNPVDTGLFSIYPERKNLKNIMFAGRLDNFKGALRTVKAFSMVAEKLPGWTLSIIGDGEDKEFIEEFIRGRPDLNNRIFIIGQVTKKKLADYYNNASFFVFPSLHESFGLVVAEAMACGLPVIVGNKTAPPEFVDDDCGLKIDADDINSISRAILNMAQSFTNYNPEGIRKKVIDRFGLENFGIRLTRIYSDLIKGNA